MPSVFLLRHGAHGDAGVRLTGRAEDHGLTEVGRQQAEQAAEALRATPLPAIYSSPRRRTMETAAIVAEHFGVGVQQNDALDELDFGRWTGRSFADLEADEDWQSWNCSRSTAATPSGETQRSAQARALAFAIEVASRHDRPPLLVTHCDIIRALVCWAERRSLDDIHAFSCEPGSLTRLDLASQAQAA